MTHTQDISTSDLERLKTKILEVTGIVFDETKDLLLTNKIQKFGLAKQLAPGQALQLILADPDGFDEFINFVTVNHTYFYREPEHFEHLLASLKENQSNPVKIWSAACSFGHEAYTIGIVCEIAGKNYKILATDIDTKALTVARKGVYPVKQLAKLPEPFRQFFTHEGAHAYVREKIKQNIRFEFLNLVNTPYPLKPTFDYIFCRNVFIYFEHEQKIKCLKHLAPLLKVGGYLYVGRSEFINVKIEGLEFKGHSIFQKV
ncbi:MAG: protein-glutamate O-methyltransferase CheR [Deltaproteobacteria bacterium]|nr:protein-glutamate O-methyltransferase CheR [Deltaproteobacteria bacterium]MCX7952199.1 protein-glutamate O-methyltransferase CheR [Deltaproteobacteria bacterium]